MGRPAFVCLLALLSIPLNSTSGSAQGCVTNPIALQVLGSGGPRANPFRSSTSYLLWVEGQARVLVDIGGGAHYRFGQSQAKIEDLSLVAISHLHPDHVSDLPAFLWLSNQVRKQALPIVGPSGNEAAPSFSTFLSRLFDEKNGAFQVLGSTLGGKENEGGGVRLDVGVVDVTKPEASTVLEREGLTVTALGIPHGNMPTLAFRVKIRDVSIVLSSDQNGSNPGFVEFAKGANVLLMHLNLPAGATRLLQSHAPPSTVGRIAQDASIGRLIVSHIGAFDLDAAIAELKKFYGGPLTIGADMQCIAIQ